MSPVLVFDIVCCVIMAILTIPYIFMFISSSTHPTIQSQYKPSHLMRFENGDEVSLAEAVEHAPEVKEV